MRLEKWQEKRLLELAKARFDEFINRGKVFMMRERVEDEKVGLCGQDLLLFLIKKEKGKEAGLEGTTGKKRLR